MFILDRERYWAFLKAYVVTFVALVGLYVVIDAFENIDEFAEISQGTVELFRNMGHYYLIKMSLFFDRLCGVITMMAAIFAVTWMQKNNELLAVLSAGVSTQRVIRPVLISAVIVSSFSVINQEFIMPRIAAELQKSPDDDGTRKVNVTSRRDTDGIELSGNGQADRTEKTVFAFDAVLGVKVSGELVSVQAQQARYIPPDADAPLKGGWLLHGARLLSPPRTEKYKSRLVKLDSLNGFPMPVLPTETGTVRLAGPLPGLIYFLKTDLTFDAVTRSRQWYQFATTIDLVTALQESYNRPEWGDIEVFLHSRLIRPLAGLALLAVSLPLVLNGHGRNMFINLGLSLATSGVFYAATFMSQYFGSNGAITPSLSAWIPLIGFGTLAVARWDTIRT